MNCIAAYFFSLSLVVLIAGCNGGSTTQVSTPAPVSNSRCERQRDNDQRCNPTRSACLRQDSFAQCKTTDGLYSPELATDYLSCYPPTLACDSGSTSAARSCAQTAANQVPVSSLLMQFANNVCQRCPGVGNDQVTDAMLCATNLTTNANNLALTLRYYADEILSSLNTCLVNSSPPADGCVASEACFKQIVPPRPATSCTADGGA